MRHARARFIVAVALFCGAAGACSSQRAVSSRQAARAASAGAIRSAELATPITAAEIEGHLRFLADDALQGRGVGSLGLEVAARYHESVFRRHGLESAFGDSYRQSFALRGSRPDPAAQLSFVAGAQTISLRSGEDFVINTHREQRPLASAGELVYVGYGIRSEAHGWDDIKQNDLKGKVLLVEVNEPGNHEGGMFSGRDMTYFGRWTYKFEHAAALGAKGVLIIHDRRGATYGWDVVRNSWSKESFFLPDEPQPLMYHGWISRAAAARLFSAVGLDRDGIKAKAERRDFAPIRLPARAREQQRGRFRTVQSENVAAILRGRGTRAGAAARASAQYVVVTAHYDHLGRDTERQGDQLFNGAVDNAAASAVLLSLARVLHERVELLERDVIFLAPTAEEVGLLGSRYFVEHAPVEHAAMVANINLELVNVWGETADAYAIGGKLSGLGAVCRRAAERVGLRYVAERGGENGFFYRSDQLSFARRGIPAVWLHEGPTSHVAPESRVRSRRKHYQESVYHTPADEMREDWDLRGTVQIARWAQAIVEDLGSGESYPAFDSASGFSR